MMRIFYFNSHAGKGVAADEAIEADFQTATHAFTRIINDRSFFGIILPNEKVLQIYMDVGGKTSLEILDTKSQTAEAADITTPIAELAIEAAFASKDIRKELDQFFLEWSVNKLR